MDNEEIIKELKAIKKKVDDIYKSLGVLFLIAFVLLAYSCEQRSFSVDAEKKIEAIGKAVGDK